MPKLIQPSWFPEFTHESLEHCEGFSGPCENVDAHWARANTFYENERTNWKYLCDKCEAEMIDYWDDQWQDAIGIN